MAEEAGKKTRLPNLPKPLRRAGVTALLIAPVLAVVVVLLIAGRSTDGTEYAQVGHGRSAGHATSAPQADGAAADRTETSSTSVKPAKPMTVQQLGTALDCTPEIEGKTKDFRQARCKVEGRPFVLLDFDTVEGQQVWLEYSKLYGGVYLVGERWALSGDSKEYMEDLSETLGGVVEQGEIHG